MRMARSGAVTQAVLMIVALGFAGCAEGDGSSGNDTSEDAAVEASSEASTTDATGDTQQCLCQPSSVHSCSCSNGQTGSKLCLPDCMSYSACQGCGDADGSVDGDSAPDTDGAPIDASDEGSAGSSGSGGSSGGPNEGGLPEGGPGCGSAVDICPGQPVTWTTNPGGVLTATVSGNTTDLCPDYNGNCSSSNTSKDAVYAITAPVAGRLSINLGGPSVTTYDSVIYLRSSCTDSSAGAELACNDSDSYEAGAETIAVDVAANSTSYLIIDGYLNASGPYTAEIRLAPPGCGNGVPEGTEQCDDGNSVDTDSCHNNCTINTAGETCADPMTLTLSGTGTQTRTGSASGDTSIHQGDYAGSCGSSLGAGDVVYVVTPDVSGKMTVQLSSSGTDYDSVLYVRTSCGDTATQIECKDSSGDGGEKIEFQAIAGTPYYIFADGYSGAEGRYEVTVSVAPAYCGNGAKEGAEECDDGNTNDGDGCSHLCQIEPAGPGDVCPGLDMTFVQVGTQWLATASGSTANMRPGYAGTCDSSDAKDMVYHFNSGEGGNATVSILQNGTTFDAALYVRSGACNGAGAVQVDCKDATSGNGNEVSHFFAVPNTDYWVFVDGGSSSASGTYRLEVAIVSACGNGTLDPGEECDDHAALDGDGCDSHCHFEGACGAIVEQEPNPYNNPNVISSACGTFAIPHAALTPAGDGDFFKFSALGGSHVSAIAYNGTPGTCTAGSDMVLALWRAPLNTAVNNVGSCTAMTGNLACSETPTGGNCAAVNYTVPASGGGDFIVQTHAWGTGSTNPDYGVLVTIY